MTDEQLCNEPVMPVPRPRWGGSGDVRVTAGGQAPDGELSLVIDESKLDSFHEECGVFGVYGHPEAANLVYLGLYALQHRGQESAGIVASDGAELQLHRAMGEVEEIFQPSVLAKLPGSLAIGHTRYSTAGDKELLNAQPIVIDCNKGKVALGHNGNLTNAADWRRKLEHRGSIFQSNSDTEVIVHLLAPSQARHFSGAIGDA